MLSLRVEARLFRFSPGNLKSSRLQPSRLYQPLVTVGTAEGMGLRYWDIFVAGKAPRSGPVPKTLASQPGWMRIALGVGRTSDAGLKSRCYPL